MKPKTIQLLVSVQNAEEAALVMDLGVDCIDIKNPSVGSLGRPTFEVVDEVVNLVADKVPLSAALGEFSEEHDTLDVRLLKLPLRYLKWGLSKLGWPMPFVNHVREVNGFGRMIGAAYADAKICDAPSLPKVACLASRLNAPVFLIDTFQKDGRSLFAHVSVAEIEHLREMAFWGDMELALAGSVKWEELPEIKRIRPNWLAVRGLVCQEGDRRKPIDPERVKRLKQLLN
ncbi:hypothetical protein KIH39_02580 [Telmatocola sphagniphila]|uniref:(5-formylfuran-3-yl)methyl phosphate synthase n=1 Tax=Telmatocola sphagniphila TaxID=1123043 RepID=A0A8E6B9F6_9BACT|nr:(5-formylfuran-3-yl)methyl phosphate synthase [Telmatocola sphagniphila]QVL32825.1 hypothetical protein KIH39_02580 [Telmatocola sphagniphila]